MGDSWPILLQQAFKGKGQRTFASLPNHVANDCCTLKAEVLRAYALVPEAHRTKFRSLRRRPGQTHHEFTSDKEKAFTRWLRSEEDRKADAIT